MIYRIQLLKGLFQPKILSYQLSKAERVSGLKSKTALILLFSLLIFTVSAWVGIGTETISKEITMIPQNEYETRKLLFVLGKLLWGFIYPAIILFLPSLFFWTLSDHEYRKFFIIQLFAAAILLLEKLILIPLSVVLGLNGYSSPFSLGIIAQYATSNELFIHFLGMISLFQIWAMTVQVKLVQSVTEKSTKAVLLMVLTINLFFWLIAAFGSYIKFERLF